MATIDELIAQLNLRADGLETTSSAKSGAYAELRALGASSVEPLMRALPGADPEAAPSIMSLLGQAGDPRAIGPILGRLDDPDGNVRRSALTALGLFSMSDLSAGGVARTLASREEDSDPSVGEAAAALRARLGLPAPDAPWYAVAAGWEPLARAFIWRELGKPDPDFRSLADQLVAYSAAERHAVWIGIGQEAPSRMGRTRAYVEALHNDPDPTSVAWGWLEGDYDLMGRVEHVIGPDDAHTLDTVEAVRDRLGSIVDVGGADRPGADTVTTEKAQPAAGEPTNASPYDVKFSRSPRNRPPKNRYRSGRSWPPSRRGRPRNRLRVRRGRRPTSCRQAGCRPGTTPTHLVSRWSFSTLVSAWWSMRSPATGPGFAPSTDGKAGSTVAD